MSPEGGSKHFCGFRIEQFTEFSLKRSWTLLDDSDPPPQTADRAHGQYVGANSPSRLFEQSNTQGLPCSSQICTSDIHQGPSYMLNASCSTSIDFERPLAPFLYPHRLIPGTLTREGSFLFKSHMDGSRR
ncbi:hypothetical protein Hypma_004598 [Hypsizygus marmoreus]|uniref:Uncharacterized protein n=1 Tax=Hypsizygus marmoreus TaxID=39966 RepID=A0A369K3D7_HYPMA|nr:hypothetical protein Hypma_004598 [Hypsizygus marmoreus]